MATARMLLAAFVVLFLLPLAASAALYAVKPDRGTWQTADRSSAGLLPSAGNGEAVVRIYSARTVRWRGIFATHSWIVVKAAGDKAYTRWDKMGWGEPIRVNGFVADGRWFGEVPSVVFAADGEAAEALVPKIRKAIADYRFTRYGDYRVWPGPNSNTFVAAVIDAVPEMRTTLPSTAIGKDFPYDGRWLRPAMSATGWRLSLGGYAGLTVAWIEGLELNLFGAVVGLDVARPGIKLPGIGRIGV
jgi:hypothetical protein